MVFTSKTIRRKQRLPHTRQFMRSLNALELGLRRLKKLVAEVESLEVDSNALLIATERKRGMMKEPDVVRTAHEDREELFRDEGGE